MSRVSRYGEIICDCEKEIVLPRHPVHALRLPDVYQVGGRYGVSRTQAKINDSYTLGELYDGKSVISFIYTGRRRDKGEHIVEDW